MNETLERWLKAKDKQIAELVEALEIVNGWFDEEEGLSPFWPNAEEAQKAYGIATVVREAIKKHKGEA